MTAMAQLMQQIRDQARAGARRVATVLDRWSGGKLTPNAVTWTGLVMHVPIAILIAWGHYYWLAAVMLVVFGLFDILDGGLAQVQGRTSEAGMLLDASTDRFKEVLLYTGVAFALAQTDQPAMAAWAAAAVGASLSVSYVKAKGEAAVAAQRKAIDHKVLNKMFSGGLMPFEIRMAVLVVGLLANQLVAATAVITVVAACTAVGRLVRITKALA